MNDFIANKNVFAINCNLKIMEIIKRGSLIKPRLREGNNCTILMNGELYEVTVDTFKEFFTVQSRE